MKFKIICPNCEKEFILNHDGDNNEGRCGLCGEDFVVFPRGSHEITVVKGKTYYKEKEKYIPPEING